jgi:RNA polymerase sigma-B factor
VEEVLEGLTVSDSYSTTSLDQQLSNDGDGGSSLADVIGHADSRLEMVEYRDALRPLLDALPDRERTIIKLRFFGDMTQSQIAERIGVSQMQISRLISRTLHQLREQLEQADRAALADHPTGATPLIPTVEPGVSAPGSWNLDC